MGDAAIRSTLAETGIATEDFAQFSLDKLLQYRLIIIPNTREMAKNEDSSWRDNLRAYVAVCGGSVIFNHDSVGAQRSLFGQIPLFPELVAYGSVERGVGEDVKVVLPEDADFDYLPGYEPGQVVGHMYNDHFMFDLAGGTALLADPESDKIVAAAAAVGAGRVVVNGMFGGHPTSLAAKLQGVDRDLLLGAVRWCLEGDGLVITDAASVEVTKWEPNIAGVEKSPEKIAVIGSADYDIRHRARIKIEWCGLKHDFIPLHLAGLRDITPDDYRLLIVFPPESWYEKKSADIFDKVADYIAAGGKAIIFMPVSIGNKTSEYFLEPFGVKSGSLSRFNPDELREVKWRDAEGNILENRYIPHNSRVTYISEPTAPEVEVIGHWYDYQDKQMSPAIIRVPYGYIVSMNIFGDHRLFTANAAIELLPEIAPEIFQHLQETYRQTREDMGDVEFSPAGKIRYERAEELRAQAVETAAAAKFAAANRLILEAESELVKAYAVSMPSPTDEARMVSLHVNALPDPEITCARLAKAGFNGIHLFGIDGNYPSDLYDRNDPDDSTDWMQKWVDTAHKHGLKIGPVIVFSRILDGSDIQERAIAEDWRVVSMDRYGKPVEPLAPGASLRREQICRARPELADFATRRMLEIIEKYPVDYVIYDYIRWSETCYCDLCARDFQQATGLKVENWPDDVLEKYRDEFNRWRASPVTGIIRTASGKIAEINPKIKIGAYIKEFRIIDGQPFSGLGQYWWEWSDYIDYIMPMATYVPDLERNEDLFKNITSLLPPGSRARLAPALAPPGAKGGSDLLRLRQIDLLRKYGGAGNVYFWYHGLPDSYLELLEIGPWRNR